MKKKIPMKNINLPGIAFFACDRSIFLKKNLEKLIQNHNSSDYDIYFFCDGIRDNSNPKKFLEVRNIIKKVKHFNSKKIIFRKKNIGIAENILQGLTEVFKQKKSVIIIEDDVLVSRNYLNYMRDALDFYKNDKLIGTISGYSWIDIGKLSSKDTYLSQRHPSWGWGTWSHVWNKMRWDKKWILKKMNNKNFKKDFNKSGKDMYNKLNNQLNGISDALDIFVNLNCFIMNKFSVCPRKSFYYNIGMDGSGVHMKQNNKLFNNFSKNFTVKKFQKIHVEKKIIKKIEKSFTISIHIRVYNKLKRIFS